MNDIKRIDFYMCLCNSDCDYITGSETAYTILFNTGVISVEQVNELIQTGEWEHDNRIVVTTPIKANSLKGLFPNS